MGVNVPSEETNNEICLICHDPLEGAHTYTLPECKHTYHTDCIVTWFRLENQSNCPYCGNKGVNNVVGEQKSARFRRSMWRNQVGTGYQSILAYARRKDAPKYLVAKVNKLRELETMEKEHKNLLNEDAGPLSIKDAGEMYYKWRTKKYSIQRRIRDIKGEISKIPVVPIIIPRVIDMS